MDINISNNIFSAKARIPSSYCKQAAKDGLVPHRNEEVAKNAEKVKQEALSAKTVIMDYDTDIDRVVITVVDKQSQEVVQQIPEADSITFMKRFQQVIKQIVNKKV